ncbi:MAG: NAD(P)-dependent oxidoreductase, partial [Pseudolysinimonas sp.]
GEPMSARLVEAGYPVLGLDPSPSAREAAAARGVVLADSPAELAQRADVVILMLPNSDIVEAVTAQLLEGGASDRQLKIVIDMSSSDPSRTRALAERLLNEQVTLVDAPVSGGVVGAVDGKLTIMVGGPQETVDELTELLSVVGSRVVHVGSSGSGHAVKALNNLLSATHLLATNEAALVAARFGIDPELLMTVVNSSSGRSGSSEVKLPRYVFTRAFDSGFSADLLEKDVGIARRLAHEVGVETPVGDAVVDQWRVLNAELSRGSDHTAIIQPLEKRYDVEIRPAST